MKKKVLFIGAHFDDIELACAGTILEFIKLRYTIKILIISNSEIKSIENKKILRNKITAKKEFLNSMKILGVKNYKLLDFETNNIIFEDKLIKNIREQIDYFRPNIIFTHWEKDAHQDHRAIGQATLSAGRHVNSIIMYQSNNYISEESFNGNLFVDTSKHFKKKNKIHQVLQI